MILIAEINRDQYGHTLANQEKLGASKAIRNTNPFLGKTRAKEKPVSVNRALSNER